MKIYVYSIISIVALSVFAGFFIVGSPATERLRKFDEQRIYNLQYIQSEIVNYWMNKGRLPADLNDLKDDLRGVAIPTDPERAGESYKYSITGPLSFSLCGGFSTASMGMEKPGMSRPVPASDYGIGQNWQHSAGQHCFERVIDQDFYKPLPKR